MAKQLILIVHNVRSALNVGSIFRSADAFGVNQLILTGYTPYPPASADDRLPHVAAGAGRKISKAALGAEQTVDWQHADDIGMVISQLKRSGFTVVALEQTAKAKSLNSFRPPEKLALVVGREVEGIEPAVLAVCNEHVQIPMAGQKESLNVSVAAAVALYHVGYGR